MYTKQIGSSVMVGSVVCVIYEGKSIGRLKSQKHSRKQKIKYISWFALVFILYLMAYHPLWVIQCHSHLCLYLIHSCGDEEDHAFSKGISPKVNASA